MRLTHAQIETIRKAAHQNFGEDASVWLFGSRVDDTKRGGDVDLYVETTRINTLMSALRCKNELEYTTELCWKAIKFFLKDKEGNEAMQIGRNATWRGLTSIYSIKTTCHKQHCIAVVKVVNYHQW